MIKKLELSGRVYNFLLKVTKVNLELIAHALKKRTEVIKR